MNAEEWEELPEDAAGALTGQPHSQEEEGVRQPCLTGHPDSFYSELRIRIRFRIRIQSGQWIRILIRIPNSDPGGSKRPTKVEFFLKVHVL